MRRVPLRWVVLGVALFVLFLILTLPARHALGWLAGERLAAQGIHGTLWRGRVQRVAIDDVFAGPVVWQMRPLQLLRGRLEYQVFLQNGTGGGELRAGRGLFGGAYLRDAVLSFPAADVVRQLQLRFAALGGDFLVDIDKAAVEGAWPSELRGQVLWQGGQVLQPGRVNLGDLRMDLNMRDGRVVGALSDQGGPLELSGELRFGADRRYELDARVKARPSADPQLPQSLQLLGAPDAQGRYPLQLSGTF